MFDSIRSPPQRELTNIQEGPQPGSLFKVPPGYKKFDMQNMGGMGGVHPPSQ
jgi:hypothetical protein